MASLERKIRERNGCYLYRGRDYESNGGQTVSSGSVLSRDVGLPDVGPLINEGEQSLPGRAFNQETVLPDVGPVISSPDDSEAEDLNTTVREQNVDDQKERDVSDRIDAVMVPGVTAGEVIKPKSKSDSDFEAEDLNTTVREQNVDDQKERDVSDRIDAVMVPDVTAGKATKSKSKSGASKKKRKSQLELLGMCTNYTVKNLVLRSGKTLVGSDTPVVAEDDAEKDATEDDCCYSDDEADL